MKFYTCYQHAHIKAGGLIASTLWHSSVFKPSLPVKQLVMRINLIAFIIGIAFMNVSASVLAQRITLKAKDAPLKTVFEQIKKQTGYYFWYDDELMQNTKAVTLSLKNASLEEALSACFLDQPLTYAINNKTIVVKAKEKSLKSRLNDLFQKLNISGKVVDKDNVPIPGVTVKVKGTELTSITSSEGLFNISILSSEAVLQFSFIGYKTKEINIESNSADVLVVLEQEIAALQEVTVVSTGYQAIPKERATGSFSQVDNKLFNRRPSTNILERLDGTVAGLAFSTNYDPTSPAAGEFSIRGLSTIFASTKPLIVVDNFPFDGDLYNLNPNDIESVTVLKDAAAASIWGSRSGNGVVVITTKKGKANAPLNIEFNGNYTLTEKPDLSYDKGYIDPATFIEAEQFLFSKGYFNAMLNSVTTRPDVSPVVEILARQRSGTISEAVMNEQINSFKSADIRTGLSKYFYQTSHKQQYGLSINGGSNKTTYYFSTGYDKIPSIFQGTDSQRITLSSGLNFAPIKQLEISAGINHSINYGADNNPYPFGRPSYYPYAKFADDNGVALALPKDYRQSYLDGLASTQLLNWDYKPIEELNVSDKTSKNQYAKFNTGIKYNFIPGLSVEVKYQLEKQNSIRRDNRTVASYYTRNYINLFTQINGATITRPVPLGGILVQGRDELTGNSFRSQLNFNRKILSDHEFSFVGGIDAKELILDRNSWSSYGYNDQISTTAPVDYTIVYNKYANLASPGFISYNNSIDRLTDEYFSYFANLSYSFKQKYILSGSGRIDQSNLFGVSTNQKSVPLWSAGLAWLASSEDFYKITWLPYLKLRATYGYNGNIDKSVSAYTTANFRGTSLLTNAPYVEILNPPNPELRWERLGVFNLGIDFGTKQDILSGSIEYYNKRGNDMIGFGPVDPTTGVAEFKGNVANIKGRGVDIELNSTVGKRFQWTGTLLYSIATDEVTKYNLQTTLNNYLQFGNGVTDVPTYTPVVGKPVFSIFSYSWAGLDPENGDPRGYINGQVSKDYAAIRGDSEIEHAVYHGPGRPTTFGAFRNTFTYNGFSLSFSINYKFGYYFRKPTISYNDLASTWAAHIDYNQRWQHPGDELITNVPSFAYPINTFRDEFFKYSEVNIEKGDHIRLQDIQISYELPKSLLKNALKRVQFYGYVSNLGLIWKANKADVDPDYVSNQYINPRSFVFGVRTSI